LVGFTYVGRLKRWANSFWVEMGQGLPRVVLDEDEFWLQRIPYEASFSALSLKLYNMNPKIYTYPQYPTTCYQYTAHRTFSNSWRKVILKLADSAFYLISSTVFHRMEYHWTRKVRQKKDLLLSFFKVLSGLTQLTWTIRPWLSHKTLNILKNVVECQDRDCNMW
jgi:hypothetical protein